MRKIKCRFRNKQDLQEIAERLNLDLDIYVKELNLDTGEMKYRKPKGKKGYTDYEWEIDWVGMPEINNEFDTGEYTVIDILFDDYSNDKLNELFSQIITDKTKSIWYPKLERGGHKLLRFVGGSVKPQYPMYIVSKGRAENKNWHTSNHLSRLAIPHYIVVEPQEVEIYKEAFKDTYATILELDMSYKENYNTFNDVGKENSTGPGAARNFCWQHSIDNGYEWHWVFDDNIHDFYYYYRGRRIHVRTSTIFRACEDFVNRYENIGIAGLNYFGFCVGLSELPAYVTNTRIYSLLLIRNDVKFRWRGRYNEDTDLSLNVLKDNMCTVQFNMLLGDKVTTQRLKGGNSDEFYFKEGTANKSQMLKDMHPDCTHLIEKWGRPHHWVDYSIFRTPLKLKENVDISTMDKIDMYGMYLVEIPEELHMTFEDNSNYINEHINEYKVVDKDIFLK